MKYTNKQIYEAIPHTDKLILEQLRKNMLNKINGNTLCIEDDDDRGYDEYYCTLCGDRVYEDRYNHTNRCCYSCWNKEVLHEDAI